MKATLSQTHSSTSVKIIDGSDSITIKITYSGASMKSSSRNGEGAEKMRVLFEKHRPTIRGWLKNPTGILKSPGATYGQAIEALHALALESSNLDDFFNALAKRMPALAAA